MDSHLCSSVVVCWMLHMSARRVNVDWLTLILFPQYLRYILTPRPFGGAVGFHPVDPVYPV